jgi:hypothetical protein
MVWVDALRIGLANRLALEATVKRASEVGATAESTNRLW